MPANENKQCTLINKCGKDIAVVIAIGYDETTRSNSVVTSNGQLEILKTSRGGIVIKNGDSDSVLLDHSYEPDAEEKGEVQSYDLVISDSKWLYPLASLPVELQAENGSSGFAPQSLTTINAAMDQAFAFYQVISAYPDSQLASDYTTALQAAQDAALARADGSPNSADSAAAAIEETVSAFFKTTKEFAQVTLADMVAADKYYKNFPAVWAQYKNANKLIKALKLQEEGLQEAIQYSGDMATRDIVKIQDALGTAKDSIDTLQSSRRTDLEKVLPDQFTAFKTVASTLVEVYQNLGSQLTLEVQAMIQENIDVGRSITKNAEESFNNEGNEQTEDDPVATDRFKPEEF